jgi:hypothetical protein
VAIESASFQKLVGEKNGKGPDAFDRADVSLEVEVVSNGGGVDSPAVEVVSDGGGDSLEVEVVSNGGGVDSPAVEVVSVDVTSSGSISASSGSLGAVGSVCTGDTSPTRAGQEETVWSPGCLGGEFPPPLAGAVGLSEARRSFGPCRAVIDFFPRQDFVEL